ncbi:DNA polymerase III subunit [Phycisphaera mikurensis]|uniref:Putative DNA polymerase III delta' subunit n=1 Tax=Phycisphaera mikurensis (strain NBRC 102666 / KCTC 22515 / FYK2301M01) TaxID=1142394 RepID=I0ICB2_PHYMF|nr:DNA polymerase III subunit [Phycisphaera mikurensis]MBB6441881.1 DNA polymerase-3 subunit delta' [Phycisphaera mikurensis]BAM02900.1 putative DNA polymerase III delta' subunit [Phycisphaera mikurensis NBRC 102666]
MPPDPAAENATAAPATLGQPAAAAQLASMLASGRPHHGLIFEGPAGVGKFRSAIGLAWVLLCLDPPTPASACGVCGSCRRLAGEPEDAGERHPDLHVVTKELSRFSDDASTRNRKLTSIPVEVLREHLIEPAHRSPQMGPRKVFVLDEAELLNPAGQNVLLKTLEEPPPETFLILVTSSADRLLPTVRSRCQRVGFHPLPEAVVEAWVRDHAGDLDAPTRGWVTRFADGSIGRAGLALDRGLTGWAETLGPLLAAAAAGRAVPDLADAANDAIKGFAESWVKENPQGSKEAANRRAAALLAHLLAREARDALAAAARGCPADDPIANERRVAAPLRAIEAIDRYQERLDGSVNLSLATAELALGYAAAWRG